MEFWAVEVKFGEPCEVEFEHDRLLHLSRASLGEVNNRGNESVQIFVEIDGKKLVMGTLFPDRRPDITIDFVFEKEFKLSHNWKNGMVYFTGFKSKFPTQGSSDSKSDSKEDNSLVIKENEPKDAGNAGPAAAKAEVNTVTPEKDDKLKKVGSEDDGNKDGSGEDQSTDEAEQSKKRAADSSTETPCEKKPTPLVIPLKIAMCLGLEGVMGKVGSGREIPKIGGYSCKICHRKFPTKKGVQRHGLVHAEVLSSWPVDIGTRRIRVAGTNTERIF